VLYLKKYVYRSHWSMSGKVACFPVFKLCIAKDLLVFVTRNRVKQVDNTLCWQWKVLLKQI
jgi:hypothetical protein